MHRALPAEGEGLAGQERHQKFGTASVHQPAALPEFHMPAASLRPAAADAAAQSLSLASASNQGASLQDIQVQGCLLVLRMYPHDAA